MTDLEERLRAELSQQAALAQPATIRPLRNPAPGRHRPSARFLAPAAAAAAVTAVAIAIAVIAPGLRGSDGGPVPAASALVRSGALPRLYMLAYQSYTDGGHKIATYAAVHSSATGRTLAQVTLPTLTYQGGTGSP